jgi:hypothetical protein
MSRDTIGAGLLAVPRGYSKPAGPSPLLLWEGPSQTSNQSVSDTGPLPRIRAIADSRCKWQDGSRLKTSCHYRSTPAHLHAGKSLVKEGATSGASEIDLPGGAADPLASGMALIAVQVCFCREHRRCGDQPRWPKAPNRNPLLRWCGSLLSQMPTPNLDPTFDVNALSFDVPIYVGLKSALRKPLELGRTVPRSPFRASVRVADLYANFCPLWGRAESASLREDFGEAIRRSIEAASQSGINTLPHTFCRSAYRSV